MSYLKVFFVQNSTFTGAMQWMIVPWLRDKDSGLKIWYKQHLLIVFKLTELMSSWSRMNYWTAEVKQWDEAREKE